jgi:hypothetical protein
VTFPQGGGNVKRFLLQRNIKIEGRIMISRTPSNG